MQDLFFIPGVSAAPCYLTSTISKARFASSSLTSITCKIPNAKCRRDPSRPNAKSLIMAFAEKWLRVTEVKDRYQAAKNTA